VQLRLGDRARIDAVEHDVTGIARSGNRGDLSASTKPK
jgi:hypothetical protein